MQRIGVLCLIILFLIGCSQQLETIEPDGQEISPQTTEALSMKLTSPAFTNNQAIPKQYTCDGKNTNPALDISNIPAKAKSLVLIMDDPDAVKPAGKVWDHWIVFNIPPSTSTISEGKEPLGTPGKGTGGNLNYRGPCPPDAEHRYYFKLYALDTTLTLPEGATKKEVETAMQGHILEQTELVGKYNRN